MTKRKKLKELKLKVNTIKEFVPSIQKKKIKKKIKHFNIIIKDKHLKKFGFEFPFFRQGNFRLTTNVFKLTEYWLNLKEIIIIIIFNQIFSFKLSLLIVNSSFRILNFHLAKIPGGLVFICVCVYKDNINFFAINIIRTVDLTHIL